MEGQALFVSRGNEFVRPGLTEANVTDCRIPALTSTTKIGVSRIVAIADSADTGLDWGSIGICVRTSEDGRTFSPVRDIVRFATRELPPPGDGFTSAFGMDPLVVADDNGNITLIFDFFPECKGLGRRQLLMKDPYIDVFGEPRLKLFANKRSFFCSLGRDGWVYNTRNERTQYYVPTRHDPDLAFQTMGDLYFARSDKPEYLFEPPPLIPPEGEDHDIFCGNIYLYAGFDSRFETGTPEPAHKRLETKNGHEYLICDAAKLSAAPAQRLMVTRSTDLGETWTQPEDITPDVKLTSDGKFFGTSPGSGLVLRRQKDAGLNGRLLMPCYRLGDSGVIISDDGGLSWRRSADAYTKNIDESRLIETEDGTIYCFGRAKKPGLTPVSSSSDGGEHWEKCGATALMSVKCNKSAVCDGKHVFAACPTGNESGDRRVGKVFRGTLDSGAFIWEPIAEIKALPDMTQNGCGDDFFAYSDLNFLPDGSLGLLCETAPSGLIQFMTIPTEAGNE